MFATTPPNNSITQVPIVIVAEDGVTSLRYYVSVTRDLPSGNATDAGAAAHPGAAAAAARALPGASPAQKAIDQAIADSPLSAILSNMTKVWAHLQCLSTQRKEVYRKDPPAVVKENRSLALLPQSCTPSIACCIHVGPASCRTVAATCL